MKNELNKAYNPGEHERSIYEKWENSGFFNPDRLPLPEDAPSYTIILPPPNITAKLHLGHSYTLALEDLMIRYRRLKGYRTLWLPGTDHAAIATQTVVERKLLAETGKNRHQLGKDRVLEEIWQFLDSTQTEILEQTKRMGASLDWSRLAFTLDEERQKAVNKMFIEMYQEGIIYRGERIVNWCPQCHSTLADDEVDYQEQTTKLYTFKYSHDFPFSISTTRPETKLGDTAVAVNPQDKRYQKYIGQEFLVEFCGQNLNIKVIADRNVEMDFGTGALGVTPAHSMADWQMATEHNLAVVKVIDEEGLIKQGFGKYSGLAVKQARDLVVKELQEAGLMEKEEDLQNNLSVCYRCDTPIEPLPSKQWFVAVDKKLERLGGRSLKDKALELAQKGEVKFIPDRFNKRYQDWMTNLHDWCISRQIWFGHSIPIWYRGEEIYCGESAPREPGWTQDEDTLDTWFSSGMWTFSTLGWPDNYQNKIKSGDLLKYHPTQVLETGYEIITLWVSRMIMMSIFALGEIPFEKVYLHGMILDEQGKKMSKSKGNGIDPIEVIEKYGADALRLALVAGATPGNDSRYNQEKLEAKRNLVNKLWNVARFILTEIKEEDLSLANRQPLTQTIADQWIMEEFNQLVIKTSERLDNFEFSLAAEELTEFTWNKLADWYLEVVKIEKNKSKILSYLLKNLLILWHPFIPFVTEAIWSSFIKDPLMISAWPEPQAKLAKSSQDFLLIQEIVVAIRNARSENKLEPSRKVTARIYASDQAALIRDNQELIKRLKTGIEELEVQSEGEKVAKAILVPVGKIEIYLMGAIDEEKEQARLTKEKLNLEKLIKNQEIKLANQDFTSKAPKNIIDREQEKLETYQLELAKIIKAIARL